MTATFYSVSLDASQSQSNGYPTSALTFAWQDAFGGTGVLPSYAFTVSTATLAGATSTVVQLTVTDPLGQQRHVAIPVSLL